MPTKPDDARRKISDADTLIYPLSSDEMPTQEIAPGHFDTQEMAVIPTPVIPPVIQQFRAQVTPQPRNAIRARLEAAVEELANTPAVAKFRTKYWRGRASEATTEELPAVRRQATLAFEALESIKAHVDAVQGGVRLEKIAVLGSERYSDLAASVAPGFSVMQSRAWDAREKFTYFRYAEAMKGIDPEAVGADAGVIAEIELSKVGGAIEFLNHALGVLHKLTKAEPVNGQAPGLASAIAKIEGRRPDRAAITVSGTGLFRETVRAAAWHEGRKWARATFIVPLLKELEASPTYDQLNRGRAINGVWEHRILVEERGIIARLAEDFSVLREESHALRTRTEVKNTEVRCATQLSHAVHMTRVWAERARILVPTWESLENSDQGRELSHELGVIGTRHEFLHTVIAAANEVAVEHGGLGRPATALELG